MVVVQGELLGLRGKIAEQPQTPQEGGEGQLLVALDDHTFGSVRLKVPINPSDRFSNSNVHSCRHS